MDFSTTISAASRGSSCSDDFFFFGNSGGGGGGSEYVSSGGEWIFDANRDDDEDFFSSIQAWEQQQQPLYPGQLYPFQQLPPAAQEEEEQEDHNLNISTNAYDYILADIDPLPVPEEQQQQQPQPAPLLPPLMMLRGASGNAGAAAIMPSAATAMTKTKASGRGRALPKQSRSIKAAATKRGVRGRVACASSSSSTTIPSVHTSTLTVQFRVNREIALDKLRQQQRQGGGGGAEMRNGLSIDVVGPGLGAKAKATVFKNGTIKLTGLRTMEQCDQAGQVVMDILRHGSPSIVRDCEGLEMIRGRDGLTMAVHMRKGDGELFPMCLFSAHAVLRRTFHDISFTPETYAGLRVRCNVDTETVAGAKEPCVILFRTGRVSVIARSEEEMQQAFSRVSATLIAARAELCDEAHKVCPRSENRGKKAAVAAAAPIPSLRLAVAMLPMATETGKRKRNEFDRGEESKVVVAPAVVAMRLVRSRRD